MLDEATDARLLEQVLQVGRIGESDAAEDALHCRTPSAEIVDSRIGVDRIDSAAQRGEERRWVLASLEHLHEPRSDDNAVGVASDGLDLVSTPHAETRA